MKLIDALSDIGVHRIGTPKQFARLPGCEQWPAPCSETDPANDHAECARCWARWKAIMDVLNAIGRDSHDYAHQPVPQSECVECQPEPPLLAGGQGRSAEEVEETVNILFVCAVAACALVLGFLLRIAYVAVFS